MRFAGGEGLRSEAARFRVVARALGFSATDFGFSVVDLALDAGLAGTGCAEAAREDRRGGIFGAYKGYKVSAKRLAGR